MAPRQSTCAFVCTANQTSYPKIRDVEKCGIPPVFQPYDPDPPSWKSMNLIMRRNGIGFALSWSFIDN